MQDPGQALSQVQQAQSTAMNPNQYLSQANQSLGVNAAQDTVNGLQGAINSSTKLLQQVAPSVMGRTANSLVNSAQASKQIQNEQAPITQTLGNQTTAYNQADQQLGQLQTKAQQQATGAYQGQQDKISYLQNIYNTLYQQQKDQQAQANAESAKQEQIREFNAQNDLAKQAAARASAASSNQGYDLSSLLGGANAQPSQQSVSSLFNGYNPSSDKFYTENVVIPTLKSQGMSAADASKAAYDYRKARFGE